MDPDTGRRRSQTIPAGLNAKEREARRKEKAREVAETRRDHGQRKDRHRRGALTVGEVLDHYMRSKPMSEGTRAEYEPVIESFRVWCARAGIRDARDLRRADLREWRSTRLQAPKRQVVVGGKRGERAEGGARSVATVNKELRALAAVLNHLRADEKVRLSRDDISVGLAREKHKHRLREFLDAERVRKLLLVARSHDGQTFTRTREGRLDVTKYKPVAPFIRAAVLTGMRLNELLGLRWAHVGVDKIYLPAEIAKGGVARVIDLTISPTALPTQRGAEADLVFGLTEHEAVAARKRLLVMGAPAFTWHALRRTCGTYLTCSDVYGSAGAYQSARRLGHSVAVAERHYLGVVTCSPGNDTLEQALGLDGDDSRERVIRKWRAAVAELGAVLGHAEAEARLSEVELLTEQALEELAHDLATGRVRG